MKTNLLIRLEIPKHSESSKSRNNKRRNGDAKRSFKHVIPKVNDALAIS